MIDWQSLTYALYDAIGVLVPSLVLAFVVDMLLLGASDCIADKEN